MTVLGCPRDLASHSILTLGAGKEPEQMGVCDHTGPERVQEGIWYLCV